jgi:hypothetical protein
MPGKECSVIDERLQFVAVPPSGTLKGLGVPSEAEIGEFEEDFERLEDG